MVWRVQFVARARACGRWVRSHLTRDAMHQVAETISDAGKIVLGLLAILLAGWLTYRVVVDYRGGIVRVKPFEVAKSLADGGFTGEALAERFGDKLTEIGAKVDAWHDWLEEAGFPMRSGDTVGEVKVPGTEFSIDGLSELVLKALGKPPIQVTGRVVVTSTETIVTIKSADDVLQTPTVRRATTLACDDGCMDALVTQIAERFYLARKPCSLELYYYINGQGDCEAAARLCAQSKPVFAHLVWGLWEQQRENYHAAVDHLGKALSLGTDKGERNVSLERLIYRNWGTVLIRVKDYRGAISKYEAALELQDKPASDYVGQGWALAHLNDPAGAEKMYRQAIAAAKPSVPPLAYIDWALLLYSQRNFDRAVEVLREGSKRLPGNREIFWHLAYALWRAGNDDEALATYERLIDLDAQGLEAYRAAADLLRRCHRLRAAHEELRRALAVSGEDQRASLRCGLAALEDELQRQPEPLSSAVASCGSAAGRTSNDAFLYAAQEWQASEGGFGPSSCAQLIADPLQAGTVYCMTSQYQDVIGSNLALTTDGGTTWSMTLRSGLGEAADARITGIALDPRHGVLYGLRANGAIARTSTGGATWQEVGDSSFSTARPVAIAPAPGHRGELYALLGERTSCPGVAGKASVCQRFRLLAAGDPRRQRAARGSWLVTGGATTDAAVRLWADPAVATTVYAGIGAGRGNGSLWKSADGGSTWRSLAAGAPVVAAAFGKKPRGAEETLYVAVAGDCRQILRSTDGGRTWDAANGGDLPHDTEVTALAVDGATLFAGTAGGSVFAVQGATGTWKEVADGLPEAPILSLAADGRGKLYAGPQAGGLYVLNLAGASGGSSAAPAASAARH